MDQEAKEYAKEQEQIAQKLGRREHPESSNRINSDERPDSMRDYARVLYSSSFRRLQGKMQLLPIEGVRFNRNRLTHSLEVAQLARSIAASLDLDDCAVAETCSLIHDIGNPPFGHYGEEVLNELTKDIGGYEGNAQAFRIVRSLEKRSPEHGGLNLTNRTLWGITKYFYRREQNTKKFIYDEDHQYLAGTLAAHGIPPGKSIDAQIMDLADEIAYAAHDLEDAIRADLIGTDELAYEFRHDNEYGEIFPEFERIVAETRDFASGKGTLDTSEEFSIVFKKELTSRFVNTLVADIGLVQKKNGDAIVPELGYKKLGKLAQGLKKLVFRVVLRKTKIQEYERRGEKVIRGLFEAYRDKKFNSGFIFLPPELRKLEAHPDRLICDYIAGMMDQFAVQEYIRFFGKSRYEALYPDSMD